MASLTSYKVEKGWVPQQDPDDQPATWRRVTLGMCTHWRGVFYYLKLYSSFSCLSCCQRGGLPLLTLFSQFKDWYALGREYGLFRLIPPPSLDPPPALFQLGGGGEEALFLNFWGLWSLAYRVGIEWHRVVTATSKETCTIKQLSYPSKTSGSKTGSSDMEIRPGWG